MRRALLLVTLALVAATARAQEVPRREPDLRSPRVTRWTFGGAIGFGFGSVNWISIAPEVGYFATERLWTGVSGRFQFTNDERTSSSFNSVDYGFGAFVRYFVLDRLYANGSWSYTSYELRTGESTSTRSSFSSLLLGGGYGQSLGGGNMVLLEVLCDVTGNAQGIYGTPWVLRAGFVHAF